MLKIGLVLWCLMPLSTIFQLYGGISFIGRGLSTLVMIGTDCIDSYKSNYHTITTTTAPAQNRINSLTCLT